MWNNYPPNVNTLFLNENMHYYEVSFKPVALNRGSVEPQGFDEVFSRVRWTLSDIWTYYKYLLKIFKLKSKRRAPLDTNPDNSRPSAGCWAN